MSASRVGWTRVAFGDVVRQVKDRVDPEDSGLDRYVAGEHMDTDDLRIRRWGTIGDGYLGPAFHMRFQPGQVLYGSRRTYLRKVGVADFEGITANTTFVLEPKDPTVLLPGLLPFVMQTEPFHEHAVKQSKGSVNPYINFSDLTWFEFPLPPIDEQRRIAGALSAIDAAKESLRNVGTTAEVLECALFDQLASQTGAPVVELGSALCESPRNGFSAIESSVPTGHWVLALSALTKTGYRRGEMKPVENSGAVIASTLKRGDLLISRSNTRELVGFPGIFDEDRSDVSWPDTMMRLRPDPSRFVPAFLELMLRSTEGRRQIQSFAAGTSASMKKINATHVQKLRFPMPSVQKQVEIVRTVHICRTAGGYLAKRQEQLRSLRRDVLRATSTERV
jgi:type I restriction enzyme S subunit